MRLLGKVLIAVLALLWVPMVAHCTLETLPGFDIFHCESAKTASPDPARHCDPGCCEVESSPYFSSRSEVFVSPESATVPVFSHPAVWVLPIRGDSRMRIVKAPPPDAAVGWQFCVRAAVPPRSPTFLA